MDDVSNRMHLFLLVLSAVTKEIKIRQECELRREMASNIMHDFSSP